MGRQNNDAVIVGPSIALLQERFRKLERMKEKREEERQIMFSAEPKRMISPSNYNSITDELFLASRPGFQDPLSLALNMNTKHADYRVVRSGQPSFSSLRFADKRDVKTPHKFDISDVDTSLHL